jgi:hypothetical protein
MGAPLTNGPVDANELETSVMKLWQEFLARYFDGGTHDVGATEGVQFPNAELHFQQSAATQPLADGVASITQVWSQTYKQWTGWENVEASPVPSGGSPDGTGGSPMLPRTRQEMRYERVAWNFWIRASGSNARATCKLAADRLAGLLGNKAEIHALGAKGISRLSATAPRAIQETDYVLRLVTCIGTLRYPVLSQISSAS